MLQEANAKPEIPADELALEKRIEEYEKILNSNELLIPKPPPKPVTSKIKIPDPSKYKIYKTREISHFLHRVMVKPGSKLKSSQKDSFHTCFYYDKDDGRLLYTVAYPGNGQKPYLKEKILYDDQKRPYSRQYYNREGRLTQSAYVKYKNDKVIMSYTVFHPSERVAHLKYHNGYQPQK